MRVFVAYKASTTLDERGRRGEPPIGIYSIEQAAKKAAKGQGWYGGDGAVDKVDVLETEGQMFLLADPKPIEVDSDLENLLRRRREIAEKLTPEEREILGIRE